MGRKKVAAIVAESLGKKKNFFGAEKRK